MNVSSLLIFGASAFFEIGGCFLFWLCVRGGKSAWLLLLGLCSLAFFAWLLTRIESEFAGRAFAAYGGIYVLMSLGWLLVIEKGTPNKWDFVGVALCFAGTLVILFGARDG